VLQFSNNLQALLEVQPRRMVIGTQKLDTNKEKTSNKTDLWGEGCLRHSINELPERLVVMEQEWLISIVVSQPRVLQAARFLPAQIC
jgi:hypothetical protein